MGESKGRKTRLIKYNLHDRGRKITGINRSNVDMKAMIALINSEATQEMIRAGQMYGYYGHEIRARYGMSPPDSVEINGQMVMLAPCCRTIELRAYENGDVEHRQEFLGNDQGEYARQQYLAKVGGFSTSITYQQDFMGGLKPVLLAGFDYVGQPNYVTNSADGALFDGLCVPDQHKEGALISSFDSATDISVLSHTERTLARTLENQIIQQFDSIYTQITLMQANQDALDQLHQIHMQDRKLQLQAQSNANRATGMVGEVMSFDSICEQANQYMEQMNKGHSASEPKNQPIEQPKQGLVGKVFRKLNFGI